MNCCSSWFKKVQACSLILFLTVGVRAQNPVFSGPQPGEELPPLKVRGVLDDLAGKQISFVSEDKRTPLVLIFVHQVNRPTIGFTRVLSAYTLSRQKEGLSTGIVWLDDDASTAEATVNRVKHALTPGAPIGVSLDGREGPGSYGLNRNVALTILVANENKVYANFALVQPSLQNDLPKVLEKIVMLVGGSVPKLSELPGMTEMTRESNVAGKNGAAESNANEQLRPLMRSLIQKDAAPDQVKIAAETIEKFVVDKPEVRSELIRIAKQIVDSGKLTNYGTPPAQDFLMRWSKANAKEDSSKTRHAEVPKE